jgi:hypothetical protein
MDIYSREFGEVPVGFKLQAFYVVFQYTPHLVIRSECFFATKGA